MVSKHFKGKLQEQYKLLSYQIALHLLNNDIAIAEIGQAVLELLWSKVVTGNLHRSRNCRFPTFRAPHRCRKSRNC